MSKSCGWWISPRRQLDSEMPLRQYFLFVGGALLILLLAANWLVPLPASNELIKSEVKLPVIRIHSELKGPEAVVIDTSSAAIAPMLAAHEDLVAPQTVTPQEAALEEAFAHPGAAPLPLQADTNKQKKTGEGQRQTSRKVTEARLGRRPILVHRPDPLHVGFVPGASFHSGLDFRETFAQLVPRSLKQAGRGEPKTRIRVLNQGW
jgi:hypothetical protein